MNNRLTLEQKAFFFEKVDYHPHEMQMSFHTSPCRFRTISGGTRAGKSMCAGVEIAAHTILPGFRIWCCSTAYELAEKEYTWALEFLSRYKLENGKKIIDLARVSNPTKGPKSLIFPWGSYIKTKSTQKTQTLLGEEIDMLCLGETSQISRDAWERYLRGRISTRRGQVLAPSTPSSDAGLFKDFSERGKSDSLEWEDWFSIEVKTIDNPTFSKLEYETAKKELDPLVFAEQFEGKFVSRRGLVFPMFSNTHIIKELPEDFEKWAILCGVHHEKSAFNNPFCGVFLAINTVTKKDFIIFDEVWELQANIQDQVANIKKKMLGKKFITTITDYFNPALQAELKALKAQTNKEKSFTLGFSTVRRIQALHNFLKIQGDGTCNLQIYAKCEKTIESFQKTKWVERKREELQMAEEAKPSTKYIGPALAVSYVVTWILMAQGIDVYQLQKRAR